MTTLRDLESLARLFVAVAASYLFASIAAAKMLVALLRRQVPND